MFKYKVHYSRVIRGVMKNYSKKIRAWSYGNARNIWYDKHYETGVYFNGVTKGWK